MNPRYMKVVLFVSASMLWAACGADPEPQDLGECPVDACADSGEDTGGAVACCIDAHGRGLTDGDDQAALARGCQGDACDPALYLSDATAVCVAQFCGLMPGLQPLRQRGLDGG